MFTNIKLFTILSISLIGWLFSASLSPHPSLLDGHEERKTRHLLTIQISDIRTIQRPLTSVTYLSNDGATWVLDPADDSTEDNQGTVQVTTWGARFKRVYDTSKGVNIEWFGGAGDGKTDNGPAFQKAKAALPHGGIINFGVGTYTNKDRWLVNKSDLFIRGAGAEKTVLTADPSAKSTFNICPIRETPGLFIQGFRGDISEIYPFKNNTQKGDNFIELKDESWSKDFPVGQEIFIRASAHYYDQEFGELNTVVKKEGSKLYLRYPLSRNYSVEQENWEGTLLENFTPPPIGKSASATIQNPPKRIGFPYSIGNDIYTLVSVKNNKVILLNPGRGNNSDIIPAGTHVTKGRQVIKSFHTNNFRMEGITVLSKYQLRVFTADNSMHTYIKDCVISRNVSNAAKEGYNFTVDCARDVIFDHVTFFSPDTDFKGGQISRSSGDIMFKHCTFTNAPTDFSEFCFNAVVDSCNYNIKGAPYAIRLGKSTTYSKLTNTNIKMQGGIVAISMDDIQAVKNSQREGCLVQNCIFDLDAVGAVFQNMGSGKNELYSNTINGKLNVMCNSLRTNKDENDIFTPATVFFKNNLIKANFKSYLFNAGNAHIEDNRFEFSGKSSSFPLSGIIIWLSSTNQKNIGLKELVVKNNSFINWPKHKNAFPAESVLGKPAVQIAGNKFL